MREEVRTKNIKIYDIAHIDLSNIFLHYTNFKNLDSIIKNGLIPQVGKNAKVIVKQKKIFFSIGEKGALAIMDSWINWLIFKPKSNLIYFIGAYLLNVKFFPKSIHKVIMYFNKKSKNKAKWSYKKLKKILDNSIYLILDLEENVDFSYDEIDEIKVNYHNNITNIYIYDDNHDNKIEFWNMNTFANKIIEPNKISLLGYNNNYQASIILKYLIERNMDYVQEKCKYLYRYYNYIYKS